MYGLITPWNGPFMLSTWKMAPCLAYGNSAVHKPSELSPLSIQVLCEIFQEAGLPDGVYNTVLGFGKEAGVPLVEHRDVTGVSFTGLADRPRHRHARRESEAHLVRARRQVGEHHLRRRQPGSGGPGGGDGDLHERRPSVRRRSRILVQRAIYDQFLDGFAKAAAGGSPAIRSTARRGSVRWCTRASTIG